MIACAALATPALSAGLAPATPVPVGHSHHLRHTDELGCAACAEAKRSFLAGAPAPPRARAGRALNLTNTDVLHYDLDIEIDPGAQSVAGSNTITVESRADGLSTFDVRLSGSFTVSNVEVDGTPAAWFWISGVELTVVLPATKNTGEQFDVLIEYSGQAYAGGFGSIVWSSDPLGNPFVYTLSETWYAYTWWPNKDDATDKATADLRFTFPDNLHLVSNGTLQSDTPLPGSRRRLHYQTLYPTATYLFCFGLGNYNTFSGAHVHANGVMPLEFAILATSDSPTARTAWLKTQDMLPIFESLFGAYPFIDEKYGIYQFGFGGGMEHQTMTGQGTTSESVTAHELGHQWWGDMVTCSTWHDIWLNEGFATYSETLWNEFRTGVSSPTQRKMSMGVRTPTDVSDTVYVYDISNISRIFDYNHSYLKGGWVVHMLRGVVGDADFFETLAQYRAAFEYGAATTSEFQGVAESVSGLDLDAFFDQWIYQPGAPAYRSSFSNIVVNGQTYAEVLLEQTQSLSYPTFDMPVTLRLSTGAGNATDVVRNDARTQHFVIPVPATATSLAFDPDLWILKTSHSSGTFVAGPPRIVQASPAPGAIFTASPPTQLTVTFLRDVQINASDIALEGDSWGPAPFALAYDAPTRTATITPTTPLPPDDYTLTIRDTVEGVASLLALDGEIAGALASGPLPSGDGLPGGDAAIRFAFTPPIVCHADIDRDNDTDVLDFAIFAANFGMTGATRDDGDLDANTIINVFDFTIFADDFGCRP